MQISKIVNDCFNRGSNMTFTIINKKIKINTTNNSNKLSNDSNLKLDIINCFALVAIRGTLTFSSFYFEQNAEKLIKILQRKKKH